MSALVRALASGPHGSTGVFGLTVSGVSTPIRRVDPRPVSLRVSPSVMRVTVKRQAAKHSSSPNAALSSALRARCVRVNSVHRQVIDRLAPRLASGWEASPDQRRHRFAIAEGARFVVLSDRDGTADLAPIPSLLLTGAVHHHLGREKTRTQVGLVVEAGEARVVGDRLRLALASARARGAEHDAGRNAGIRVLAHDGDLHDTPARGITPTPRHGPGETVWFLDLPAASKL